MKKTVKVRPLREVLKTGDPLESDIQKAVAEYLAYRGFRVYRRNVAGLLPMKKGGAMRVGETGQADLYGRQTSTGRALEVEVKRPGEHPSPAQTAWLECALEDNVIAFWCDSVKGAESCLKAFGI